MTFKGNMRSGLVKAFLNTDYGQLLYDVLNTHNGAFDESTGHNHSAAGAGAPILPAGHAVQVYNATGGTLSAGTLVYVTGYDLSSGYWTIAKADPTVEGANATYVMQADIANLATGTAHRTYRLTGLDTHTASQGDKVYLSSVTPGSWTLSEPGGTGAIAQVVGSVAVADASVGAIEFNLLSFPPFHRVGSGQLQSGSVTTAKLASNAVTRTEMNLIQSVYLGAPILATTNRIVASVNLTNTTFTLAAQPDVPRNITITVTDTTPSLTAGTVVVTGLDCTGTTVTETLTFPTLTLTGTKIFASVTSVVASGIPGPNLNGGGDETIVVGVGNVIGLPNAITATTAVKHVYLGGARVAAPTLTAGSQTSGIDVSASTYNGTKVLMALVNVGQ